MRKFIYILLVLVLLFIVLTYISISETKDSFRTCTVLNPKDVAHINFKDFDSVTVAANTLYEASLLKEIMQGEQYRKAWATPVTVPIVYLDTLKGGLTFVETGGGKQTHSLEYEDNKGVRYTFRSLSKDPEKLVPQWGKILGLENIIVDGISAQHPYAALVVAELSEAAQVLHTHPKLVFLPKQSTLGEYNNKYGDRLYFFEYESEGKVDWTGWEQVYEIMDTDDLLELKMEQGQKVALDYGALIRARLFDVLIGDWDRHAKQWGWVIQKKEGRFKATPLPTDRDNAFFEVDGVLPTIIANKFIVEDLQNYGEKVDFLPGLVIPFDAYFLRTVSREQFKTEAKQLQHLLNDQTIENAFRVWPQAIDSLDGQSIRKKLKARRDLLITISENFYGILQDRPMETIVLKGCEDLVLPPQMQQCFDCNN